MSYKPTLFDDDVNISKGSNLLEILKMLFGVVVIVMLLFVVSMLAANILVKNVTLEQEIDFFASFESDALINSEIINDSNSAKIEKILNKIKQDNNLVNNYRIFLADDDEINAYAMIGGVIVITKKLFDIVDSDAQLAFVIGHEIGHFKNRHHLQSLGQNLAFSLMVSLISGYSFINDFSAFVNQQYSKEQEIEADNYGLQILKNFGGNKEDALDFFKKISPQGNWQKLSEILVSTHPTSKTRIENVESWDF